MNYVLYASNQWIKQAYGLNPNLSGPIHHTELPPVMHSGLTNWPRVFDGYLDVPNDKDFKNYDVVHMNIHQSTIGDIHKVKKDIEVVGASTKIVCNPDAAIEMWESFGRTDLFLRELNKADKIFCVHPVMSNTLEILLNRKVYTMPHPTDVEGLRKAYKDVRRGESESKLIVVYVHAYDQNYLVVTEVIRALKSKYGNKIAAVFCGPTDKDKVGLKTFYDDVYPALPFGEFFKLLKMADVVIDTAVTHSYGRVPVECAVLDTPCIGDLKIESMEFHPYTRVNIFDGRSISGKIEWLLFEENSNEIKDPVYYSYDRCKERFVSMMEDTDE